MKALRPDFTFDRVEVETIDGDSGPEVYVTMGPPYGYALAHINPFDQFGTPLDPPTDLTQTIADRIVACVNACEGLNPDKLPEAVASLRAYLKASPKGAYDSGRLDAAFAALTEGE